MLFSGKAYTQNKGFQILFDAAQKNSPQVSLDPRITDHSFAKSNSPKICKILLIMMSTKKSIFFVKHKMPASSVESPKQKK